MVARTDLRLSRKDGFKISHETIYKWIRIDKRDRGTLYKHLRHRLKHRSKPVGAAGRYHIPDRVGIEERPKEADGKRFGDFEMDTIVGPNNQQAIVTLVERSTNRLFMEKLKHGKDSKELALVVIDMLKPFKDSIRTITTDNGREFAAHRKIAEAIGTSVYFTDPYSSWQKELLRMPMGSSGSTYPKECHSRMSAIVKYGRFKIKSTTDPEKSFISHRLMNFFKNIGGVTRLLEQIW